MNDAHETTRRMVDLTRDLVLIPSTEKRPDERARCFQLLTQHLEQVAGVELRRFESNGFESLVATPSGVTAPDVLMVGHLDVIEHGEANFYRSEVRDGRIYGPGSGDMKGQLAIMVELFRDLQEHHPGISVGVAITSDEERGGEHGVRYLFGEAGLRCGMALVPDGGSPTEVTVAEKGILHLRLSATGHEIHAARPWLGPNAVLTLAHAICDIADTFRHMQDQVDEVETGDHWYPTFSPTIVSTGNQTVNCLPADAVAHADIRFPPPLTTAELLTTVQHAAGDAITVEAIVAAESTHLAPDPLFIEVAERAHGQPVSLVRASGGSDARFIANLGIPVVLSRPLVGELHGREEWINIDSMVQFYRVCEEYTLRRTGCWPQQRESQRI